MILKHSQNGNLKRIFTLVPANGKQEKLMWTKFWQWWKSNICQLFLPHSSIQFGGRIQQGFLTMMIRSYCVQAKSACWWQRRKWTFAASLELEKDTGQIFSPWNVHGWHSIENWFERHQQTPPKVLEKQKLSSKWKPVLAPSVWTRRGLTEKTRWTPREIQESSRGPSVPCDISQLALCSP